MRLNTRVITDQEEFRGMKDEWNILLSKSRTNTYSLPGSGFIHGGRYSEKGGSYLLLQ